MRKLFVRNLLVTPFCRLLIWILPAPNPRWRIAYWSGYADLYNTAKKFVIAWHKARLSELDHEYARQQGSMALIAARHLANKQGIGPLDPRYPQLEDHDPVFKKFLSGS